MLEIGPAKLPSPQPSEAPDGPGAFLALIQRLSKMLIESVATVADLPPVDNYVGQTLDVLATPGAVWRWNGVAWQMFGVPVFADTAARAAAIPVPVAGMQAYMLDTLLTLTYFGGVGAGWRTDGIRTVAIDTITYSTSVATGVVVATVTLPALPYPTVVFLDADLSTGFAGAGVESGVFYSNSAGVLTQAATLRVPSAASKYAATTHRGKVTIPANTAVVVNLNSDSSATAYYVGTLSYHRVSA